ncbi:hypothetical protein WR164_00320 [Philodulcilactobacillus myokoensis]|uniref:Lysozyme n=1 Tax=Philodulcilactobacillus myokoensis TaxID=2929573 RepID=A0A9W6AZM9_9LACO|nr:hypothetical protein [Philodulcilactobacillus myokoensis]GLB46053.1 hypothetical protein WR164_00320 [Philodulcilactobacillus myokoensis]
MKINRTLKKAALGLGIGFVSLFTFSAGNHTFAMQSMKPVFDLSNWQGNFSDNQAQGLKNETSFEILKAQQGTYQDADFANNSAELNKYNVPFGIYSYSTYYSVAQAQAEARSLYNQDPNAKFYVNDLEGYYPPDVATIAWAQTMHSLTNRPVILYGNTSYLSSLNSADRNAYDTLWVAGYGDYQPDTASEPDPSYHYDLWQYSDRYPSVSLGESVDASTIPDQGKPISYWIGDSNNSQTTTNSNNSNSNNQNNNSSNNQQNNSNSQSNAAKEAAAQKAAAQRAAAAKKAAAKAKAQAAKVAAERKAKKAAAKKAAEAQAAKQAAAQRKAYIHANYYSSSKIKKFRVTAKNGINVYYHGKKVNHFKRGVVIKVNSFKWYRTMTKATNSYGATFTSNKKFVKAIWH